MAAFPFRERRAQRCQKQVKRGPSLFFPPRTSPRCAATIARIQIHSFFLFFFFPIWSENKMEHAGHPFFRIPPLPPRGCVIRAASVRALSPPNVYSAKAETIRPPPPPSFSERWEKQKKTSSALPSPLFFVVFFLFFFPSERRGREKGRALSFQINARLSRTRLCQLGPEVPSLP